jgi:4-hydroxybenzoate polyprenyltransferase
MRPKQWVKNSFVVAPIIFSGLYTDLESLLSIALATLLFSIGASVVYVINDYADIERDRSHAVKSKTRPLASGVVSKREALLLLCALLLFLLVASSFQFQVGLVVFAYILLNLGYTFYIKHKPVADIFTIAAGFVLRVYAGTVAIEVPASSWMLITTFCLALFLASIKRRQELMNQGDDSREVLKMYSLALVNRFAEMSATGSLLFYSLFVMTMRPELVITIPLVIYGLFRYWFIVESLDGGESPTDELLSDAQLLSVVVLWAITSGFSLWLAGS